MNYLQDKRVKSKKYKNIGYFVVVLLILFYFRNGVFNIFSHVTNFVFHPVVTVGHSIGGGLESFGSFFLSRSRLLNENESLRQDLNDARAKVVNYEVVENENKELKEVLGVKDEDVKMVLATILSKPNQSPYDTLVVDLNSNEVVSVGDRVFAYGDIPVGRVAEVGSKVAKVVLYSNSGEKVQVVVGVDNIYMDVVGRGGGNFEMSVPNDFVVTEGETVVLPGLKPYVLGIVEKVISDPRDAFQKVLLVSPVNIQELKFVEIEI